MTGAALRSLPNLVSLSRLGLAAAFVLVPYVPARIVLLVVASASDYLDGWLARRTHTATSWGALIDPIADRMFVLAAVAALLFEGSLTSGQYFILIARDLATAIGFLVARAVSWLRPVKFQARWLGKIVTTLQLLSLIAALVWPRALGVLIAAVGVASAASIADYTLALWHARVRVPE
jgi:CDP-diacylglycerol---glycerol-3-phosphate 3-phosphatidyltransferase